MSNKKSIKKDGIFDWYLNTSLLVKVLVGLVAGAAMGLAFSSHNIDFAIKLNSYISPFGALFIRLLNMIIVPIVFFTLIVGIAAVRPSALGRVGVRILIFYFITSVLAAVVGLFIGNFFDPGQGINLISGGYVETAVEYAPISQVLLNIVPENLFKAFSGPHMMQIIFAALISGISLAFLRESKEDKVKKASEAVYQFCTGVSEIMFMIIRGIMQYAPIGVFALMFGVFVLNDSHIVRQLSKFTGIVYLGFLLQLLIVYGIFLAFRKINILSFIKKARNPIITAFVTRSTSGTLPLSMQTAEKMGISKHVYAFSLPVGASINMDGTMIYQSICVIFIANAVGIDLTMTQMFIVVLASVLSSFGSTGVPGSGALMLVIVLQAVGLNVEAGSAVAAAYAMILGIDAVIDMGRTSLNMTGDLVGSLFVSSSEKELNIEQYKSYSGE